MAVADPETMPSRPVDLNLGLLEAAAHPSALEILKNHGGDFEDVEASDERKFFGFNFGYNFQIFVKCIAIFFDVLNNYLVLRSYMYFSLGD